MPAVSYDSCQESESPKLEHFMNNTPKPAGAKKGVLLIFLEGLLVLAAIGVAFALAQDHSNKATNTSAEARTNSTAVSNNNQNSPSPKVNSSSIAKPKNNSVIKPPAPKGHEDDGLPNAEHEHSDHEHRHNDSNGLASPNPLPNENNQESDN